MTPASQAGKPTRIAQSTESRPLAGLRQTMLGINTGQGFPAYQSPIVLDARQAVCLNGSRPNDPGDYLAQEPSDSVPEGPGMAAHGN